MLGAVKNGKPHATLIHMASRHLERPESTRVPDATSDTARALLAEHGKTVHGFLGACLAALIAEPARVLALVEPYWPQKQRGRPRKARTTQPVSPDPPAATDEKTVEPAHPRPAKWAGHPLLPHKGE